MKRSRKSGIPYWAYWGQKGQQPVRCPAPLRKVHFEPLEQRVLLSGDLNYAADAGAALNLMLRLDEPTQNLQLVDNATSIVLIEQALAGTDRVVVTGAEGNDALTVDYATPFDTPVLFDGGSGSDTLIGPDADSTWNVTGPDSGTVGGVNFSGIENLTGAADNQDTFVFDAGSSLSGRVEGGAGGFDTVVLSGGTYLSMVFNATGPDSGTILRDADVLAYAGMEPVTVIQPTAVADLTFNLDNEEYLNVPHSVRLADSSDPGRIIVESLDAIPMFETHIFAKPTNSLTINLGESTALFADSLRIDALSLNADLIVDGQGGRDEVTVAGNVTLNGHDLTIAAESIRVNGGVTVDATGTATDGSISLIASDADNGQVDSLADLVLDLIFDEAVMGDATATVDLTGATLKGDDITVSATSSVSLATGEFSLGDLAVSVAYAASDASVILEDTSIDAAGYVDIDAVSAVTATAVVAADSGTTDEQTAAAIAVAVADSSATARISGSSRITAAGTVSLSAENTAATTATADGTNTDAGATLALSIILGNTKAYIDGTASIDDSGATPNEADSIRVSATTTTTADTTSISTPGGTQKNASGGNEAEDKLKDYGAKTADGDIGYAAGVAITYLRSDTEAYISSSGPIVSDGEITIASTATPKGATSASGENTSSDATGVGVAVAIGIADVDTLAFIGGNADLTASAVNANAIVNPGSAFETSAVSGAGAGNTGVAGALALGTILVDTEAVVSGTASVDLHGADLGLTATETLAVLTEATASQAGGSTGVGASVALTVGINGTRSEIEDGAALANAGSVLLSATTTPTVTTKAEAGASGDGTSVGGAFAISYTDTETKSRVGTGTGPTRRPLTGTLTVKAYEENGTTTTTADGTAAGADVGVGAAVALNVGTDSAVASTERAVSASGTGGSVVEAKAVSRSETTAKASAKGENKEAAGGSQDQTDKQRAFGGTQAAEKGADAKAGKDANQSTSDGPVGVAAAIAVNVTDVTAEASVRGNLATGGLLSVHSSANGDASVKADGSATVSAIKTMTSIRPPRTYWTRITTPLPSARAAGRPATR